MQPLFFELFTPSTGEFLDRFYKFFRSVELCCISSLWAGSRKAWSGTRQPAIAMDQDCMIDFVSLSGLVIPQIFVPHKEDVEYV